MVIDSKELMFFFFQWVGLILLLRLVSLIGPFANPSFGLAYLSGNLRRSSKVFGSILQKQNVKLGSCCEFFLNLW